MKKIWVIVMGDSSRTSGLCSATSALYLSAWPVAIESSVAGAGFKTCGAACER